MLVITRLFWGVFTLDVVFLLWALTKLSSAGSDYYGRLFLGLLLVSFGVPAIGGLLLFLAARNPPGRMIACALVLAPLLIAGGNLLSNRIRQSAELRDRSGADEFSGKQAALAEAIFRSDGPAVIRLATRELVLTPGKNGSRLFDLAFRDFELRGPDHATVLEALLRAGADPNIPLEGGALPLERACAAAHRGFVKILLQGGADPNRVASDGSPVYFCTLTAPHEDRTQLLETMLSHGADPNALAANGRTAAVICVLDGNPRTLELLLRHGADPARKGKDGESALSTWAQRVKSEFGGKPMDSPELLRIDELLRNR